MALSMVPPDCRTAFLSDPRIYASLRTRVARRVPAGDVDDIVQATMLEAHTSRTYPAERSAFQRWLYRKGTSNAIDWLRRRARASRILGAREGDDAEAVPAISFATTTEARDRLRFAAAHLQQRRGRRDRVRWLVRRARGETFDEIAARDGVAAKTVERAIERLQEDLRSAWTVAIAALVLMALLRSLFGRDPHREEAFPNVAPIVDPSPPPRESDAPSTPPGTSRLQGRKKSHDPPPP